jgi:voltage-gated potassium channel
VKSLGFILSYLASRESRRNVRILVWMLVVLVVIVAVYSVAFHYVMEYEGGPQYSWFTAVYWALVTMSTLGYGDITFATDLGRAFSVLVLMTGALFILVLLPFTFIQFVFLPWVESSRRARAPRQVDRDLRGHVVLSAVGPIESALIERLSRAGIGHVTIVADVEEALRLHDDGLAVLVGPVDDPDTFRAAGLERAALVVATAADTTNTNIAFTVREISESVTVVATANAAASVDILELAGCDHVLQLGEILGRALARRVLLPDGRSQVVGEFGTLLVAEAASPPSLVGHTLAEAALRRRTGLSVGGVWRRGRLEVARPETVLARDTTLVLAGSAEQLASYDALFEVERVVVDPVVIIGGGRVGRAAGRALEAAGFPYCIVEQQAERVRDPARYVVGDAADLEVLEAAGIRRAPSVLITTHDDDVNVYLTLYCRRLRPDVQVIARARLDRNVSTLHRAGADAVLSYASAGANAIWNVLSPDTSLQLTEGLDVFRVPVPRRLAGRTLRDSGIRDMSGCTVVAVARGDEYRADPPGDLALAADLDLVLIGDSESEQRFLARFPLPRP